MRTDSEGLPRARVVPGNTTKPMHMTDFVRAIKQETLRVVPPILSPTGAVIGHLTPVTHATLHAPDVIAAMTRWRATHQLSYASRFTPTAARTGNWLRDVVLPDDRRVLFLIHWNQKPIGLTGFRDLADDGYEGDNLVRGERGGGPDFMLHATLGFHAWAMSTLRLERTRLRVLASNHNALTLHLTAGCTEDHRVPLYSATEGDQTTLVEKPDDSPSPPVDYMVHLTRTLTSLRSKGPQYFDRGDISSTPEAV